MRHGKIAAPDRALQRGAQGREALVVGFEGQILGLYFAKSGYEQVHLCWCATHCYQREDAMPSFVGVGCLLEGFKSLKIVFEGLFKFVRFIR